MKLFISILFVIAFIFNNVTAQLNPQPYENNPVVPIGQNGSWDDSALWWSCVTEVNDTFYLVYNGTGNWPSEPASIGLATSIDGFTFTKSASNPILSGDGNGFDAYATTGGSLYFENGTWYLYYSGKSASPNQPGNVIGRASAGNPHGPWSRTNDTLITVGGNGEWDDEFISPQTILSTDTGLVMYYWAGESWPYPNAKIGMATSTDGGSTWQKYNDPTTTNAPYAESDPILKPGSGYDSNGIWGCSVLWVDGKWKMFYGSDSGSIIALSYATSENGIVWEKNKNNPILNPAQDPLATNTINGPSVVFWNNTYFVYYSYGVNNIGISLATSGRFLNVPDDFPSIQGAINFAIDGDVVLVDEGTYFENINFKGKAITVASHFILDQDTSHISKTIIDGSKPSDPNQASVVTFNSGEDTTSVLCGFTITGGTGLYTSGVGRQGGGIVGRHGGAKIINNIIENNSVISSTYQSIGGGICFFPNRAVVENNIIRNNLSKSNDRCAFGGGVFLQCAGRITGNTITNNQVSYTGSSTDFSGLGGGISCFENDEYIFIDIQNNIITENLVNSTTRANGGGVDLIWTNTEFRGNTVSLNKVNGLSGNTGCGMRMIVSESSNSIVNNVFSFNTSIGGEYTNGGGLYLYQTNGIIINENNFEGNESTDGGGLLSYGSDPVISNNFFKGNLARYGGGIVSYVEAPVIVNNIFAKNHADSVGGGVAFWTEEEGGAKKQHLSFMANGGAMGLSTSQQNKTDLQKSVSSGPALIINNTFTENSADSAGGAFMTANVDVDILNSILWDNTSEKGAELWVDNADVSVSYSDIQGGRSGIGNIDVNPYFSTDTLYCLSDSSLCIDAGDPDREDPEDPDNPGQPLWPAKGTMRSDMGVYGGYEPLVGINDKPTKIPFDFALHQNYPNPFNPTTTISYQLPVPSSVELSIYNLLGQKISTLVSGKQRAGKYEVQWDASRFSSGIYLYKLSTNKGFSKTRKLILLK